MRGHRLNNNPPTEHTDFEWARGLPKATRTPNNNHWMKLKEKIDNGYFDFSFCFWGSLGRITKPDSTAAGNVFYIKVKNKENIKCFESFDFSQLNVVSAGALQLTSDDLVRLYSISKNDK